MLVVILDVDCQRVSSTWWLGLWSGGVAVGGGVGEKEGGGATAGFQVSGVKAGEHNMNCLSQRLDPSIQVVLFKMFRERFKKKTNTDFVLDSG